jgi:hypothetical protein
MFTVINLICCWQDKNGDDYHIYFFVAAEIACGLEDRVDISFGEMREFSSTHSPT